MEVLHRFLISASVLDFLIVSTGSLFIKLDNDKYSIWHTCQETKTLKKTGLQNKNGTSKTFANNIGEDGNLGSIKLFKKKLIKLLIKRTYT